MPLDQGDLDAEVFELILEAGGIVSVRKLYTMLLLGRFPDVTFLKILTNAKAKLSSWNECGIFSLFIMRSSEQSSVEMVQWLKQENVDLKYHQRDDKRPGCIIDAASRRGFCTLVRLLGDLGATLTDFTLPFAIESGNEELVRMLVFDMDVDVCRSPKDEVGFIIPLAAAIKLKNPVVRAWIEEQGALIGLRDPRQMISAMHAAAEAGDLYFIEQLVDTGAHIQSRHLGCALSIALRHDHEKLARALIDAGAALNVPYHIFNDISYPFSTALKRCRNPSLIDMLLEAGAHADPSRRSFHSRRESPLVLAIERGDKDIIRSILDAGADPDGDRLDTKSPLTEAIYLQREDIFDILLKAGADLDHHQSRKGKETALFAATSIGDVKMV